MNIMFVRIVSASNLCFVERLLFSGFVKSGVPPEVEAEALEYTCMYMLGSNIVHEKDRE